MEPDFDADSFAEFVDALDSASASEAEATSHHHSSVSTRDWEVIRSLTDDSVA